MSVILGLLEAEVEVLPRTDDRFTEPALGSTRTSTGTSTGSAISSGTTRVGAHPHPPPRARARAQDLGAGGLVDPLEVAAEVVLAKAAAKEAVQLRKATRAHVCCVPGCGKRLSSASSLRNHAKTHLKRLKMTPAATAAAVEG